MFIWKRGVIASLLFAATCMIGCSGGDPGAGINITSITGGLRVSTENFEWEISTSTFNVINSTNSDNEEHFSGGQVSVDFLGSTSVFGPPSQISHGYDWIELRGWADESKNLWYIARYQFFSGQPLCRLVLTLVDRHDSMVTYNAMDSFWESRLISNLKLEIDSSGGTPVVITQHNSYSYSEEGDPWVEPIGAAGTSWEWANRNLTLDTNRFQILHSTGDGENMVVWHPMYAGEANVTVLYTGYPKSLSYKNGKGVTYEVLDASSTVTSTVIDQGYGQQVLDLGTFTLNTDSVVRLKATGTSGLAIAGPVLITPTNSDPSYEITVGERHPGYLSNGPVTIAVKDFWQHNPMSLFRTASTIGWTAIENPEVLMGGMSITIETIFSTDGSTSNCLNVLYQPPSRYLPSWVDPIEGSIAEGTAGTRFNALLETFKIKYEADLESMDNFGWKNWGDYQISSSYQSGGNLMQSWANLQYDMPTGLLIAWIRTGDQDLWRYAQASIRHLMDIDTTKFSSFHPKFNGGGYRKGDMKLSTSHFGAEVVIPFSYAFRSLLIYYELTGEEWARDIAKQSIDNLTYLEVTNPKWAAGAGDRDAGWMLRAILEGEKHFPNDPTYDYQSIADNLADKLVAFYQENGKLPGNQPVWQGQMVESLALYHRATGRSDVADAIIGHVDYLLNDALRLNGDTYELLYCYGDDISSSCPTANWSTEYNYLLLWLSSITYAYQLTGDPYYANWAETLFTYCEEKLQTESKTRNWSSLLSFPFLYVDSF